MTRSWQIVPGRVLGKKDGVPFFDTDAFPVQYANESQEVLLTGQTITFPDFQKGNAYCWQQWDGPSGNPTESAISVVTIPNQEWGPSASLAYITAGCNLDDTVIGTVPALADGSTKFFVKLTRTASPSNVNGISVPVQFEENVWVECPGGSLPVEALYPFARMIQLFLAAADNGDGTRNVIMRRLMSTVRQRQGFYRSGNNYSKTGWNYGGTYGSVFGVPVAQIDTRGASTDLSGIGGRFRRNGSNPASTTDNTNYRSIFTGDIRIVPGRAQIAPLSGGGDPNGPHFLFTDEDQRGAGDPYTFTDRLIGDADPGRVVFALVMTYGSSGRSISSVTIAGVVASLVATTTFGSFAGIAAIYAATVPSGTTATVVVDCSGSMTAIAIDLVAGYNISSLVPDAIIQSSDLNTNRSLPTTAGGFALACSISNDSWGNYLFLNWNDDDYDLSGIENAVLTQVGDPATDGGILGCRAFQNTDGTTLQLRLNNPGTPPVRAWVAASFH